MPDFGASVAFSAIFALGITAPSAVTALVTIGTFLPQLALTGLSIGYSAIQQANMRKALAATNDTNAAQSIVKQAIPPHRLVLGTATTGGALFFYEAKPPYIWMGILLAAHESDGLDSLYVGGQQVFIGADGFATSVPFRDGANTYLEVSFRPGTLDQAIDPIIARDFPTMPATFRQRGHATLVVKAHYGYGANRDAKDDDHKEVYGDSGQFLPLSRIRGATVYDPRAPGQLIDDEETWAWSDNAALCLMRYLTHRWGDLQLVSTDRIDWGRVAIAADLCDHWETSADGTAFKRHTINGVVQSTDDPFDVIENMCIAMGGRLILDRGKIYPVVRTRRTPVATLHSRMLRGGVEFASATRDRDLINIVSPTFIAPDRDWQEVAGPVLRRSDLISADGREREITLRGAFVEDHRRVQRLAKAVIEQSRLGKTISCGASLEAHDWSPADVIRVHLEAPLDTMNGTYELAAKEWDESLSSYRLTLIEYSDHTTEFDPADEQPFTLDDDTLEAEAA